MKTLKQKFCRHSFEFNKWEHGFNIAAGWDNKIYTCSKCGLIKSERVNLSEKYPLLTKADFKKRLESMNPLEDHPIDFDYSGIFEFICDTISSYNIIAYRSNQKISMLCPITNEMKNKILQVCRLLNDDETREYKERLIKPVENFLTTLGWDFEVSVNIGYVFISFFGFNIEVF